MPTYETPGVYAERLDGAGRPLPALRMDVTGFVGIAERGPLDLPVPVESFRQFEARFGGFTGGGALAYALKGFFDNGGGRAWIVRVASKEPRAGTAAAGLDLPPWRIAASSPGSWGNALSVAVQPGRRVATQGEATGQDGRSTRVSSTSGFTRDDLVLLTQPGPVPTYLVRVCALVDGTERRLWWLHPEPRLQRPSDLALPPLDPGRPLLLESLSYTLIVRERGRVVATFADLSLVPAFIRSRRTASRPCAKASCGALRVARVTMPTCDPRFAPARCRTRSSARSSTSCCPRRMLLSSISPGGTSGTGNSARYSSPLWSCC
jgi:hypothetical protein